MIGNAWVSRERFCAGRSTWWESCGRCVAEIGLQKGVMYIMCNLSRVHLIEKIANIQAVRRPGRSSSISCVRALFFFNLRSCVREESSGLDSNTWYQSRARARRGWFAAACSTADR
jgi:hypothetical protein